MRRKDIIKNRSSLYYRLSSRVRKLDIFGHPVSLRYNKNPTYKSKIGGVFTIMVVAGLIGFFTLLLYDSFSYQSFSVTSYLEKFDIVTTGNYSFTLNRNNFDISMGF